jgi:hypothetical protein
MPDETFRPICFMVMPFGKKNTGIDSPAVVDFDALWHKALKPALEQLGYRPVRADQDTDALIINEMLERLYYSDLVLADISIANANVYYEIGIRHAARETGCVVIAAAWSHPVFDLAQIRHLRYQLTDGSITDTEANNIQTIIFDNVKKMGTGASPINQVIKGYPQATTNQKRAQELAGQLEFYETLSARINTILKEPPEPKDKRARALVAEYETEEFLSVSIMASMMIKLIRDAYSLAGDNNCWHSLIHYIDKLPGTIKKTAFVQEQYALAKGKVGEIIESIQLLESIINLHGESFERRGLIGGRYKQLYLQEKQKIDDARSKADDTNTTQAMRTYLNLAIENYERGMYLDLNEFYCSCNLPALYRERCDTGDEDRALETATLARNACERKMQRNEIDEWTASTLLMLAFAEREYPRAKSAWETVKTQPRAHWMNEATKNTIFKLVHQIPDKQKSKVKFLALYEEIFQ